MAMRRETRARSQWPRRLAIGPLLVLLVGCGLTPPERDYRKAMAAGTDAAYQEYIARYPDYPLAEGVAYSLAYRKNSIEALERHLQQYPSSKTSAEARLRLGDLRRQEAIRTDFAAARPGDVGALLRKHQFHRDAWAAAGSLVDRTWVKLDADTAALVELHLKPAMPKRMFYSIPPGTNLESTISAAGDVSRATLRGIDGDDDKVYCEDVILDGAPLGPVVWRPQKGVFQAPPP